MGKGDSVMERERGDIWLYLRLGIESFGHHVVAGLEAAVALVFELGWFCHGRLLLHGLVGVWGVGNGRLVCCEEVEENPNVA